MRITPWLLAGALALAMSATASAGPKNMGGNSQGMTTGSTSPGASAYAPGQVKKKRGMQSAKKFAPGQNSSGRYNTPPGQRM